MTGRTGSRMLEIRRRTQQYRKRREGRVLFTLRVCSLLLFAGIGILLRQGQSGVAMTVTCIRCKKRQTIRMEAAEDKEEKST